MFSGCGWRKHAHIKTNENMFKELRKPKFLGTSASGLNTVLSPSHFVNILRYKMTGTT